MSTIMKSNNTGNSTRQANTDGDRKKDIIEKTLKTIVPIGVSAAMIVWMAHKVDFRKVWAITSHD